MCDIGGAFSGSMGTFQMENRKREKSTGACISCIKKAGNPIP